MNHQQIADLHRKYYLNFCQYVLSNRGTEEEAMTAFNDVMLFFARRPANADPIENMAAFIFRAAKNNFVRLFNRRKNFEVIHLTPPKPPKNDDEDDENTAAAADSPPPPPDDNDPQTEAAAATDDEPEESGDGSSPRSIFGEAPSHELPADEQIYRQQLIAAAWVIIRTFKPRPRLILELSFDDSHGLTNRELAETLDMSEGAFNVARHDALKKLKQELRNRGYL